MTTETETETPVTDLCAEIHVPLPVMGRKIALKEDTDVMLGNILPAGTTGYVIRHPSPLTGDQSIMYVAFDQRPSGFEDSENSFNWFVDVADVEFIESHADGLPVVHLIGDLLDDDGAILIDGSVGFVLGEDLGDEVLTVAFPQQDFRRNTGVVAGQDEFVLHYINRADLQYV